MHGGLAGCGNKNNNWERLLDTIIIFIEDEEGRAEEDGTAGNLIETVLRDGSRNSPGADR